ncbi:hypothetical protein M0P65_05425 [Candidatus Gracilibacteria bacterium]|nr:hypothetical protein [Candidatus Gracilibacteria bacterium]
MITYNSIDYLEVSLLVQFGPIEKIEESLSQGFYEVIQPYLKITKPSQSNIKEIHGIIKELDSYITKTQSIKLLQLYLLAEDIKKRFDNCPVQKYKVNDNPKHRTTIKDKVQELYDLINDSP